MKKLLSLALVMVLLTSVLALVGCNGLWGFDDDDDVVGPATPNWSIKNKVVLDDTTSIKSLRAAATSGYGKLVAKVYRISDNMLVEPTAGFAVADNGEVEVKFLADVNATYTIKITHPDKLSFYLERYVNKLDANKSASDPLPDIGATSTVVAFIASSTKQDFSGLVKADGTLDPMVTSAIDGFKAFIAETLTSTVPVSLPKAPVAVTGVALDASAKSLSKAETFQLKATVSPSDATVASVTWSSSDTAVATVTNGLVTAISGGVANIEVKTTSLGKTAVCVVTVVVPVTGITLDKPTLSMEDGSTANLVATIAPADATNKTVTWTSSDATVATVVNGVVTSLKPGTTTITATAAGDTTKTATCNVTVNAVAVTGVTLNKQTASMFTGQKETLIATLVPANATIKTLAWNSDNTTVATVSSTGEVSALAVGNANITVTADGGKTAVCAVSVAAAAIPVTGVALNKTTLTLTAGAKETLLATVSPGNATNNAVSWVSATTSVATVSSTGEVIAVAPGTAIITVTTADGGKTSTCTVTVNAAQAVDRKTATFSPAVTGLNLGKLQIVIRTANYATYTNSVVVTYNKDGVLTQETFTKDAGLTTQFKEVTLVPGITTPYSIPDFSSLVFAQDLPAGAVVAIFNLDTLKDVVTYTAPN